MTAYSEYKTRILQATSPAIEANKKAIISLAERVEKICNTELPTEERNKWTDTLSTLAMIHAQVVQEALRQKELEYQEGSAEHYIQQREQDQIFYNWVDDI